MRAGADLRLLRAAVFAAACSALAAAGHVLGGGAGVPLWAVAAGALLTWAFALALTGRERRSWPGIALALALAQLALHLFFCLAGHVRPAGGHPGGHGPTDPTELAARLLCGDHGALSPERATALLDDAGLLPHLPGAGAVAHGGGGPGQALLDGLATLGSWPMLLGHLLAALAAGWLLRQGEAALWLAVRLAAELPAVPRWARRLLAALRLLLRPPSAGAAPRPAPARRHRWPHPTPATRGTVLPDAVVRRGPPAGGEVRSFTLAA